MSTEGGATGYIVHHLTPLSVGEGFWTLHLDTLFFRQCWAVCLSGSLNQLQSE